MYIVDSHCDSIMRVAERKFPLINPYNLSQKYPQVQMYAMFAGMPGEDAMASYRRVTRYIGLFSIAIENEKDKIVKVTSYAEKLESVSMEKSEICMVIGSSYGLSDIVKQRADMRLSVSRLTFPHQLMRVILLEATYRAFNIQRGTKYHK